jgi:hypothetical protein
MDNEPWRLVPSTVTAVEVLAHADLPNAIAIVVFSFEDQKLAIRINTEDDTLVWDIGKTVDVSGYPLRLNTGLSNMVVGKKLVGLWIMANERGYEDAIELDFQGLCDETRLSLQLVSAASRILVFKLTKTAVPTV